jgi:hypothetical protein
MTRTEYSFLCASPACAPFPPHSSLVSWSRLTMCTCGVCAPPAPTPIDQGQGDRGHRAPTRRVLTVATSPVARGEASPSLDLIRPLATETQRDSPAVMLRWRHCAKDFLNRLPAHDADGSRSMKHLVGALDAHRHVSAGHEERGARLLKADGARLRVLWRGWLRARCRRRLRRLR